MKTSWYLLDIDEIDQFQHFDALPIGCVILKDGDIISANEFFAESTGHTKVELRGKKITDYLLPSPFQSELAHNLLFKDLLDCQKGLRKNLHLQLKSKSGKTTNVAVSVNEIEKPQSNGATLAKGAKKDRGCLLTITPLEGLSSSGSEEENIPLTNKEILRKSSETTLKLVLDNSIDGYVAMDLDFNIMFYNQVAENTYDRIAKKKIGIGENVIDLLGDIEGVEKRVEHYNQVIETGKPFLREVEYIRDGETISYQNRLSCLRDEQGKVIGLLSCARDVSELVKSQVELAERNSTLKAVLDSSRDGIAALDLDLNVLACNEQAVNEFKKFVNVDLRSDKNIAEQISPEELARWKETIYNKVFLGEELNNIVKRESTNETFENIYTPVKNTNGDIIGALEISRDITDLESKRIELQKSEQRFKGLVDQIPSGLAKVNQNGKISYVSPQGAQIMGYSVDELLGNYVLNFIAEEDKPKMLANIQSLLSGKAKKVKNTFTIVQKDDKVKNIEGDASISRAIDNEFSFLLAFNDITEKREAQVMLDKTASNFVTLFMNMHDAVIVYDHAKERYVNCNEAGLKLFNRSKEELLKGSRKDFVAEYSSLIPGVNLHERMNSNRVITAKGDKVVDSTTVLIDGEGRERLVSVNIVPKSDNEVYLIMKDITDANEIEHLLKEKTSVYEALINNSFDGIDIVKYYASDGYFKDGELLMRNDRMSSMVGGSKDELFDSDESLLSISPEYQPNGKKSVDMAKQTIVQTIKEGKSLVEYRFEHDKGSFDVEASQKLIQIDDFVYMIKNYRDITDAVKQRDIIKEQIEALNAKNEEMKIYIESNLQLENFAYIASHDLKAPIRSVISFAQLLKNNAYDALGPKNGRFLDIIITASTNMQVLIDDLLAYSRINTQEVEFENVDMPKLLKHLLIEINQSIAEKNGEVVIKNLPATLVGDAGRLRQIFQNLITNGMKFHKEGETPKVEIDFVDNRDHYKFTVRDFGIGIEEQYLREIFLMFKKLHSENKYKGTGIGLSICKKIVEQHEGDIWVESTLGEGSIFHFTVSKSLEANMVTTPS